MSGGGTSQSDRVTIQSDTQEKMIMSHESMNAMSAAMSKWLPSSPANPGACIKHGGSPL